MDQFRTYKLKFTERLKDSLEQQNLFPLSG